ncbi:MAG: DUF2135 domain-containing protein, partial [Sphingobacteriales bacterium]
FEAIERRRVDPGLLEKLEGNSFRTRIYPFNAGGVRTIRIGYHQELKFGDSQALSYQLPLAIRKRVPEFSIKINVLQTAAAPVLEEGLDGMLRMEQSMQSYTASQVFRDYIPDKRLTIRLPKPVNSSEILVQRKGDKYYFLINSFMERSERKRARPDSIVVLWDVSLSARNRDRARDIDLLRSYLSQVGNASVQLICFSNAIVSNAHYDVNAGRSDSLMKHIGAAVYDGGTSFRSVDFSKLRGDEVLLFSDGHNTFGATGNINARVPVYCINSASAADFPYLHQIARQTGGEVIDLSTKDNEDALRTLSYQSLRFLGVCQSSATPDCYPSYPVTVENSFSLSGIMKQPAAKVGLLFGYGNTPSIEKTFEVDINIQESDGLDVSRIWAGKKIAELEINYEANKEEIMALGKRYGIVTRNTSLIVLETVQDYITYGIEPPADLQAQYARMTKGRNTVPVEEGDPLGDALDAMDGLVDWYNTDFRARSALDSAEARARAAEVRIDGRRIKQRGGAGLTGIITERGTNDAAIGAVVEVIRYGRVVGGAVTDENGRYTIAGLVSGSNYELRVRYIGFKETRLTSVAVPPRRLGVNNFSLEETRQQLEDVVVIEYKVPLINLIQPGTTTLTSEQIAVLPTRQTSGAASLIGGTYHPGRSSGVSVAGARSNGVLYIVDGVQISGARGSNFRSNAQGSVSDAEDIARSAETDYRSVKVVYDPGWLKSIRLTPRDQQYEKYLELRPRTGNLPAYFLKVADYFLQSGCEEQAIRVLSNIAELGIEDYELYKMLGYKLREAGEHEAAVYCFKKVLEWRPAEPQSYRDYGLALKEAGLYQQSFDTLYTALTLKFTAAQKRMYAGYEQILLTEMNALIREAGKKIAIRTLPRGLVYPMPVDIRVVLNWNMNDSDVDLWVTEPGGEKCNYNRPQTTDGGLLTDDFTEGFGPEQYQLREAKKGTYIIEANYFGDRVQKAAGPATILAEIYTHFGTPQEERRLVTLQLDREGSQQVYVAEIDYK